MNLLVQPAANWLGAALVSGIIQGFVLAAVVGVSLRMFPRMTAALRYSLWSLVLLAVVTLPLVERLLDASRTSAPVQLDPRWSLALAAVWIVLSAVRAGSLGFHAFGLWRLCRRAVPVMRGAGEQRLLDGVGRTVLLCTSAEVDRPSVVGFFAPRILIPGWLFHQLSEPELEHILLHELEHLRRGDDWWNLLQKLSLVVFPLNPVLLWVERRLCFERELACDDGVLRRTHAPRAYATSLASVAERSLEHSLARRGLSLALGALGAVTRRPELTRRVDSILRRDTPLPSRHARMAAATLSLGLLAGAAGLARCPVLVAFVAPTKSAAIASAEPARAWTGAGRLPFADGIGTHATLVNAALVNTPVHRPARHATLRRRSVGTKLHRATISLARSSSVLVPRLQLIDAAEEDTHRMVVRPYVLVPSADGWIVIQLMG